VPLSHQHSPMDVVRLDLGRDRAQDQVLASAGVNHFSVANLKLQSRTCAKLCTLCLYLFGVFYKSGITQTPFLERSAIMPF
jgi:hypothetical protein